MRAGAALLGRDGLHVAPAPGPLELEQRAPAVEAQPEDVREAAQAVLDALGADERPTWGQNFCRTPFELLSFSRRTLQRTELI